jgi:carboxyl-terminal processing protease
MKHMKSLRMLAFLAVFLSACGQATVIPTPAPSPTIPPTILPAATVPTLLSPELQAYLDHAIDLIRQNSIYAAGADWDSIRTRAEEAAAGAQSTADLYPVLEMVLHATGDRHGYIMPPADASAYFATLAPESLPDIQYEIRENRFGYILIPAFVSGNIDAVVAFADQLQDAIRSLDAQGPCGWVLDLRTNEGGNGAAMLLGVGPLLTEGTVAEYSYYNGQIVNLSIEGNQFFFDDVPLVELDRPAYHLAHPGAPVAILTNQVTTSAGELVAIAFRGWPNTRSFGQKTLGRTTAPQGFTLDDGAILGISAAWFADHTGQVYQGPVVPDQVTSHGNPAIMDGSLPQPAIDWLLSQQACAGK